MKNYYVTYRNEGRSEKTYLMTEERAKEAAEFLKFQGAKGVRIRKI